MIATKKTKKILDWVLYVFVALIVILTFFSRGKYMDISNYRAFYYSGIVLVFFLFYMVLYALLDRGGLSVD